MNGKNLSVLFISSWYPNKVKPLLGIFVKRHAAAIAQICSVSAIYVCAGEKAEVEDGIEENIYTLRVYYKRVTHSILLFSSLLRIIRYIFAWKKAVTLYRQKKGKPDIVNLNVIFPAGAIAIWLKRVWKIPYVITEHWTGYFPEDGRYKGFFMKMLIRKAVSNASAVIPVSNALKERMLELGLANSYYIIPNVVDTALFDISNEKKTANTFNFIHVSALDDEQKNVSGIIRAFHALHKVFPKSTLTIVGKSNALNSLIQLSELIQLKNTVTFTGEKIGVDLVKELHGASAFILFSNYENLPCVMLEALCCGIPVITTNVGDIPIFINSTNGILIDAGKEELLYEAMAAIVKGSTKFSSPAAIRASVINKVDAAGIARQFLNVYNNVLKH